MTYKKLIVNNKDNKRRASVLIIETHLIVLFVLSLGDVVNLAQR